MVAMLRSRARKTGVQTSHYRGVSLLKQTHKWHAQINVGGKQVRMISEVVLLRRLNDSTRPTVSAHDWSGGGISQTLHLARILESAFRRNLQHIQRGT
jgi:hypothetical protein